MRTAQLLTEAKKIMPVWVGRIHSAGNLFRAIDENYKEYVSPQSCLVGEAHGFSGEYVYGGESQECNQCQELNAIKSYTHDKLKINYRDSPIKAQNAWLTAFLTHWREAHAKK